MKTYVPRPHQELIASHLRAMPRKIVMAGCGAGKTVESGTYIAESLFDRVATKRWLIVAPKTVAQDTWAREFAKWTHLHYLQPRLLTFEDLELQRKRHDPDSKGLEFGERATVKKRLRGFAEPIHVCSYDAFPWVVKATGVNFPYDGLLFDEYNLVKDNDSIRFKAAKHAANKLGVVTDVIELGGTPIPKGYEDLMAPYILLDGGERLGRTKTEFRSRWQEPDVTGRSGQVFSWKLRRGKLDEIQGKIAELAVSVDYDTGVELIESDREVRLPPKARELYRKMEDELLVTLGDTAILSANQAVKGNKLLQICNGYLYDEDRKVHPIHQAKLEAVLEDVQAATSPILLAYLFREDEQRLAAVLGKRMRLAKDKGALDAFRAGDVPVLGFHPETMSYGVDGLQGASNTVMWFTPPYRFDWYHQVFKRLQRDGQRSKAVFVRRFVCPGTLEEDIVNVVLSERGARNAGLLDAVRARRRAA